MKIKRGLVLLFCLLLIVPSIAASESINIDNELRIAVVDIDPNPARPGQYVDVYFSLSVLNLYSQDLEYDDFELSVFPEYPLSLYPEESRVKSLGNIREGSFRTFKYRFMVNENSEPGDANLRFKFSSNTRSNNELSAPITINVQRVDPLLEVAKVTFQPERIEQGSVASMALTMNNPTGGLMRDITLKLELPAEFVSVGESNTKKINQISAGKSAVINFDIMADPNADAKAYKIPLKGSFSDAEGNEFGINESLGVLVGAAPELQFDLEDQEVYTKGDSGEIIISVSNIGPSEVKFLSMEITPRGFELLSPSRVYLGDLEPDDFETAQFDIFVNDESLSEIDVEITYKDAFNTPLTEEISVPITIYSGNKARALGLSSQKSGPIKTLVYVFLFIFVYQIFRNWRREKDLAKAVGISLRNDLRLIRRFIVWVLRGFRRKR
jgi:hypothetical protein